MGTAATTRNLDLTAPPATVALGTFADGLADDSGYRDTCLGRIGRIAETPPATLGAKYGYKRGTARSGVGIGRRHGGTVCRGREQEHLPGIVACPAYDGLGETITASAGPNTDVLHIYYTRQRTMGAGFVGSRCLVYDAMEAIAIEDVACAVEERDACCAFVETTLCSMAHSDRVWRPGQGRSDCYRGEFENRGPYGKGWNPFGSGGYMPYK